MRWQPRTSTERDPERARGLDIDEYLALGRVGRVAAAPIGDWLAVEVQHPDRRLGRFRSSIWRQPTDGSAAQRLLSSRTNPRQPCFQADGALCFLAEVRVPGSRGNTLDQVLRLPATALEIRREAGRERACEVLSDEPVGVRAFLLAEGRRVLLAPAWPELDEAEQRDRWLRQQREGPGALHFHRGPPRLWDHWLGGTAARFVVQDPGGERRLLAASPDPRALLELEWDLSADGRWLVSTVDRPGEGRIPDRGLALWRLEDGARWTLGEAPRQRWSQPCLDATGRRLAAAVHERRDGAHGPVSLGLWTLGPEGALGPPRRLAEHWDRWPEPCGFRGDEIVLTARDRGRQRAFAVHDRTGVLRPLGPAEGCMEVHEVAKDGALVGTWHDLLHPPRPVRQTPHGEPARPHPLGRLPGPTTVLRRLPAAVHWEEAQLVGAEGAPVHQLLLLPASASAAHPVPGLLWVHGGPVAHWADAWHWRWNAALFASFGYAVALPNPRGSTGYGQAWIDGVYGNSWGGACATDVRAALAALRADPRVDAGRVGAVGASFGGWMMNHLGGRERGLRCIVSHAGIFDHRAMGGATDIAPWWNWEQSGGPWTDPAHERWSPHRDVAGWTAPTLVVHGERDYRVPIDQGLALFEALQQHGVQAELLAFPDEGHWIQRPANVAAFHQVVLDFLARHLGGRPPTPGPSPSPW